MGGAAEPGHESFGWSQQSRIRLAAAIAAALIAGLLAALLAAGYDDLSVTERERARGVSAIPVAKPVAVSVEQLEALAGSLRYPIYWTGPQRGSTYELTRMADGRAFIRYLPPGASVGAVSIDFRFVATYPDSNAFALVRKAARGRQAIVRRVPGGGLAVADEGGREIVRSTAQPLPTPPVFFARPRSDVLVEIYDPIETKRAFRIVTSGQLRPVR